MRGTSVLAAVLAASIAHAQTPERPAQLLGIERLRLASPAFTSQGTIPPRYTCDGANVSPPLTILGVPDGTRTLALIVEESTDSGNGWVHWLVYNLPPDRRELGAHADENLSPAADVGRNGWGRIGYGGPCPDEGRGRYLFKLYALDAQITPSRPSRDGLRAAMSGHVLEKDRLVGFYERPDALEMQPGTPENTYDGSF